MSDFLLTAPSKSTGGRDPHVFEYRDTEPPESRALNTWLDAQHLSLDLDAITAELRDVSSRREAARLWFSEHGPTHPRYQDAQIRQNRLGDRYASLLLRYRWTWQDCWLSCATTYAVLQHVTDVAGWIAAYASRDGQPLFTGGTPHGVWRALRGDEPGGSWPIDDKREGWIETRVASLEVWNNDWMRERLAKRLEEAQHA